ncbi:YchJ family protein [Sansalvadorimonas sp. 2012CJ34-2]|uniref:YchJ family protein n=1 Tax=Parendozoicomonas callyspongiae TaxID=2942213 RepID=A0ABT0PKW7_9GAMM|nr:YchJ family protein [Sansalvadorimonas sp. 2012CJ34-2]MCL6272027.1 YchJ family protein [Sansalvadorimonas sp. 2012CJ34-2]
MTTQNTCPCGSANTYDNCCGLLHQGKDTAQSAEQLMRSRYTAWSLGLIDYLHDTTWSKQQAGLNREEMTEWAERTQWLSLEILDTMAGQADDNNGEVEFLARFQLPPVEAVQEHRERSKFVVESGRWFFVDPSIPVRSSNIGRNDPCPCGSGKKYKKCCG